MRTQPHRTAKITKVKLKLSTQDKYEMNELRQLEPEQKAMDKGYDKIANDSDHVDEIVVSPTAARLMP